MFPLSLPWRLLIVGVLLLSAVTAAFIKGIDYQQTKDAAQAAKELQYRDQQLIKGVAQHAEDQSVIAVLSDYANRMSIHPSKPQSAPLVIKTYQPGYFLTRSTKRWQTFDETMLRAQSSVTTSTSMQSRQTPATSSGAK